jgi:hypothetical protein
MIPPYFTTLQTPLGYYSMALEAPIHTSPTTTLFVQCLGDADRTRAAIASGLLAPPNTPPLKPGCKALVPKRKKARVGGPKRRMRRIARLPHSTETPNLPERDGGL